MNLNKTARQIMSAMQSDAFNEEACVKILRDAQFVVTERLFGYLKCPKCGTEWTTGAEKGDVGCPTCQGAAQPKPESWQEIAKEAALRLTGFESGREHKAVFKTVLAAIERSHSAQPQPSEQKEHYSWITNPPPSPRR